MRLMRLYLQRQREKGRRANTPPGVNQFDDLVEVSKTDDDEAAKAADKLAERICPEMQPTTKRGCGKNKT